MLVTELVKKGNFRVMEREQLDAILQLVAAQRHEVGVLAQPIARALDLDNNGGFWQRLQRLTGRK